MRKLWLACCCWCSIVGAGLPAAGEDLFADRVASIFERRCVSCHHGDEPKGKLALTTSAELAAGGESGAAIEPGKPDESLLLEYISGDEPQMPKNADPLTGEEIAAIRQWIAAGAVWPADTKLIDKRFEGQDWWSLKPVSHPEPPRSNSKWPRSPIDAFILAKLREQGLSPSPEADRRTLIRRLTYDLHGLPPTPEEIDAFLADEAANAYEKLVDRLLASPRYGERWGRHWLDVVHYGETHGYDKDKPRPNAWPYRDYVIRGFNEDKPYSRFVEEQLAGDVLYPDDPRAVVATGFIAAGPWDFVGHVELREGTADKEIARSNDRDDMLAAAISTFVSLTAHCARCHDHKFDPIPQADYYRLQAVFAGVDRADRAYDPDPQVHIARRRLLEERSGWETRRQAVLQVVQQAITPEVQSLDQRIAALQQQLAALPGIGAVSQTNGYHSLMMKQAEIEQQPNAEKWVQIDLGRSVPIDEIALVPARPVDFADTPGFGFPVRFRIEVSDDAAFASPRTLVDRTAEDFADPGDEAVTFPAQATSARYVRVTATRLRPSNDYLFALAELQVRSDGQNLALGAAASALDSIEGGRWGAAHVVDGYSSRQLLATPAEQARMANERKALSETIQTVTAQREQQILALLDEAARKEYQEAPRRVAEIDARLAELPPQQMAYGLASDPGSLTTGRPPRPIPLLHRGDVRSPGDLMPAGALSCLQDLEEHFDIANPNDEGARRAALARWIVDRRNPLTRRSIVNRVWQYHFGRGLVDTPNDFGRMGSMPTHPELLDWLSAEFLERGESIKELHRWIVTSAAYRQSSRPDDEKARDADNRYLWRANRLRLDAESVRDAMLYVSGDLDITMGGTSVQQFVFKDDHSPIYDYAAFDVDNPDSRRRSV